MITGQRQKLVSKYIFPSSQQPGRQKPASLPLSIKVFSISCPDYFFVNLSFTTPGQYGERNMLFPIIPDSMLSGRPAGKYSCAGKYTNTVRSALLAERYWEIPISINYVLCRLLLRDASDSRINPLSWLRLIFPRRGKNKAAEREEIIIGDFLPPPQFPNRFPTQ